MALKLLQGFSSDLYLKGMTALMFGQVTGFGNEMPLVTIAGFPEGSVDQAIAARSAFRCLREKTSIGRANCRNGQTGRSSPPPSSGRLLEEAGRRSERRPAPHRQYRRAKAATKCRTAFPGAVTGRENQNEPAGSRIMAVFALARRVERLGIRRVEPYSLASLKIACRCAW